MVVRWHFPDARIRSPDHVDAVAGTSIDSRRHVFESAGGSSARSSVNDTGKACCTSRTGSSSRATDHTAAASGYSTTRVNSACGRARYHSSPAAAATVTGPGDGR